MTFSNVISNGMKNFLCPVFFFLALCPLKAVVVAGANGGSDNANNTTSAQIQASLGINGAFYDNVISYSDAGAVYLGWRDTVNGPVAYALSEMHITFANTMVISGVTYSVSRQSISGSDLAVLSLTQTSGIMPPLPVVVLASSTPSVGSSIIMAGFGRERAQMATTDATVSDAVPVSGGTGYTTNATLEKRWGTNNTIGFGVFNRPTTSLIINGLTTTLTGSIFSTPSTGQWLTTNEAQAVSGDSGGGMFDSTGHLLGLMVTVSDPSAGGTEAFFGQETYFTNVPTYKSAVDLVTGGALVPEPPVSALALYSLIAMLVIRWTARRAIPARNGVGRAASPKLKSN